MGVIMMVGCAIRCVDYVSVGCVLVEVLELVGCGCLGKRNIVCGAVAGIIERGGGSVGAIGGRHGGVASLH